MTIQQMEEKIAQKVNSDHTLRSSMSQQQKQLEDDKSMMRVTSTTSSSRKMNREKSSIAVVLPSDEHHVLHQGSRSRRSRNKKRLQEVVASHPDDIKPLSVRSLPLQQQSSRFEHDDRHNSWHPGTSLHSAREDAPRHYSSSKKSIASMSFASQDLSETTMTTATTTTSKQQGRRASRSPTRQPYRTKFEPDLSPPTQQRTAGLDYAYEGTMAKYGTSRTMDAANSNEIEYSDPLRHPEGPGNPFPEEERVKHPTRLRKLYRMEDDLLLKGHIAQPNIARAFEARSDQDSVYSNIPPPPVFLSDIPLPSIARRVTKDAPALEPSDSLPPGAYRAIGGLSNHSVDDDSDDLSVTYSERMMRLSESERQREEARTIELARNHLLSCQSLQVSQDLTFESQSQRTGLGASMFLDEDRRPEEPEQQLQPGRKSGMSSACLFGIGFVVVLVVGAVVGLVIGLKGNPGSSQAGPSGGSDGGDCVYDLKLAEQCQEHGIVSDIPSCVQSRYRAIQTELELQGIGSIDSCSAGNLGLLSMASANQQMYLSNYVMSSLYFGTAGPSKWDKATFWATDSTVCEWEGVTCNLSCKIDKNNSRSCELDPEEVIGISLNSNGLAGSIPSELGLLSALETVTLSSNSLTGEVPAELGNLSEMTFLDLSQNKLSGSIPSTIAFLTSLQEFRMTASRMTGAIPTEIGLITSLAVLDLSINNLNGQLPSELGNLSSLEHLEVDENLIGGKIPVELSKCLNLEILSASQNLLTGFIPTEIGLLTSLSKCISICRQHQNFPPNTLSCQVFCSLDLMDMTRSRFLLRSCSSVG